MSVTSSSAIVIGGAFIILSSWSILGLANNKVSEIAENFFDKVIGKMGYPPWTFDMRLPAFIVVTAIRASITLTVAFLAHDILKNNSI